MVDGECASPGRGLIVIDQENPLVPPADHARRTEPAPRAGPAASPSPRSAAHTSFADPSTLITRMLLEPERMLDAG